MLRVVTAAAAAVLLVACGGGGGGPPAVADVAAELGCEGFEEQPAEELFVRAAGQCTVQGEDVLVRTFR